MGSAFLKLISGNQQGLNVTLTAGRPLIIGRKHGDLVLDDQLISSRHARIVPRDSGWVLQDLGSTNGTTLDGKLVREAPLQPGSEIGVGNTRMVLFLDNDEPEGIPSVGSARPEGLEIAWMLDEELVELRGSPNRTHAPTDVIDQDLRLPPGLRATMEVVAGEDAGKVFRFSRGNMVIGRRHGEIPLGDLEVSRRHAVIELFGRRMIFVRDLGSTNGTYHNGRRVAVAALRNGDTVGIGRTVLRFDVAL